MSRMKLGGFFHAGLNQFARGFRSLDGEDAILSVRKLVIVDEEILKFFAKMVA